MKITIAISTITLFVFVAASFLYRLRARRQSQSHLYTEGTNLMKKDLFWLIEINALFWAITFIGSLTFSPSFHFKLFSGFAFFIAAWIQHRAFYETFKKRRVLRAEQGAAANP